MAINNFVQWMVRIFTGVSLLIVSVVAVRTVIITTLAKGVTGLALSSEIQKFADLPLA